MVDLLEPLVLFVQSAQQFERALRGLRLPEGATIVYATAPLADFAAIDWNVWTNTNPTAQVDASVAAITHDTVAKYLFTSGSTGMPKAATITQRMLCISVKMHLQLVEYPAGTPPMVVLDWMPWSHVASGNVIFCMVLSDEGTIYIDEGKPVHGAFDETLRNLREVSPTVFNSVPLGYTMLAEALEADPSLGECFFRNLERLNYAGARLPDSVFDRLQALAVRHTGKRIAFLSAFGSTETAAAVTTVFWPSERAGFIGLPHPAVELKLVPLGDERYEVRVKSPVITPGYFKQPEVTSQAFDDEGYFMMGDALQFVDPHRPQEGLTFSGRVTEEFKLLSGIFVRVGDLRVEALEAAHGLLADAVVAGADELFVSLLAWPNLTACRLHCQQPDLSMADLVQADWLRSAIRQAYQDHNRRHGGSSMQIRRVMLLEEPPQLGAGEITDKGYVNQRAVLKRRAHLVAALYSNAQTPDVIEIA
jgi:feruloyl-CoA synthase